VNPPCCVSSEFRDCVSTIWKTCSGELSRSVAHCLNLKLVSHYTSFRNLGASMKRLMFVALLIALGVSVAVGHQSANSDQAGRLLALEKAWNLALEQKGVKAPGYAFGANFRIGG
jgi:hypothetical protein